MSGSDIYQDCQMLPVHLQKADYIAFQRHLILHREIFHGFLLPKAYKNKKYHLPIIAGSVTACDIEDSWSLENWLLTMFWKYRRQNWQLWCHSSPVPFSLCQFCKFRPLPCTLHQCSSHDKHTQMPFSDGFISWLHQCHRACKRDTRMNICLYIIMNGKRCLCEG